MVVDELSTQMLQQALRAGVRDVLSSPTESGQLLEAVERAAETLTVVPAMPSQPEPAGGRGRLISVFSNLPNRSGDFGGSSPISAACSA